MSNPFGTIFNPASIANVLRRAINGNFFKEEELVLHNGLFHLMDLHGDFSGPLPECVIQNANHVLSETKQFLQTCEFLVVTFGTSWVYCYNKTKAVVSNCHKLPSSEFCRTKLTVDEIVAVWGNLLDMLRAVNPKLNVLFTVSPVRHMKDGAHENQLSKSTLLLAVDQIVSREDGPYAEYFPSYEILLDELRDYRFYAEDMMHVSKAASSFIFEKFGETYFSKETNNLMNWVKRISQAMGHRVLNEGSPETRQFALSMIGQIQGIIGKYPNIKFDIESDYFKKLLNFTV